MTSDIQVQGRFELYLADYDYDLRFSIENLSISTQRGAEKIEE